MDIREMLRYLQTGASNRQIAREMEVDRRTVSRYRHWAQAQGLLVGPLPPLQDLQALAEKTLATSQPPQNTSSVEPYRELVTKLVKEKVEVAAIKSRLQERGFSGSYSAVYRFVRAIDPRRPEAVVRVERPPGEEAQVDFGYAGRMLDPERDKLRRSRGAGTTQSAWSSSSTRKSKRGCGCTVTRSPFSTASPSGSSSTT
jgi:transposase